MSYTVPITQDIVDSNVARFEDAINQNVPKSRQAFARVMAICQAMTATGQYKYAAERIRQSLVISADLEGLQYIGQQYGVDYKYATPSEIQVTLIGNTGTLVTSDNYWIGDSNGVRYELDADVELTGSTTSVVMTAIESDAGSIGDLESGEHVTVGNIVSGLRDYGLVTATNVEGVDDEDVEDYRARLLNVLRSKGGGGNSADYRRWAEETPNVIRAYPYAGRPYYDETDAVELVTNGEFTSNVAGWTDSSTGDGRLAWNPAGKMDLTTIPV